MPDYPDLEHIDYAVFDPLYRRPGFMIRRAHQIASAIFIEACRLVDITPNQYAVMFVLNQLGSLDQASVGRFTSLDRSTTALVIRILEERRFVEKRRSGEDRRKAEITLTVAGRHCFEQCDQYAQSSVPTVLAPFDEHESEMLLALLDKFINHFSPTGRPL